MIPLFTEEEFNKAKSRQLLPLQCEHCNKTFHKTKNEIQSKTSRKDCPDFCSRLCSIAFNIPPIIVLCKQCGKPFKRINSQIKKSKNHFCSQSCSAKYHNAHKTTGTRVSKFERWLQEQLLILYPTVEFHFNRKDAILSELDIYIPFLKLAFELNGIFHYEPIYGSEKLNSIQNNDKRKFQACFEKGIELCIIDTSAQKYFKESSSQKYLNIISTIINLKLSNS